MSVLNLIAKLKLDGKGFKSGLDEAKKGINNMIGANKDVFGFLGGPKGKNVLMAISAIYGLMAKQAFDAAREIKNMSDTLDVSINSAATLGKIFKQYGYELNDVQSILGNIEKLKISAMQGDEKSRGIFNSMGIDYRKSSDSILMDISKNSKGKESQFSSILYSSGIATDAKMMNMIFSDLSKQFNENYTDISRYVENMEKARRTFGSFFDEMINGFMITIGALKPVFDFITRGLSALGAQHAFLGSMSAGAGIKESIAAAKKVIMDNEERIIQSNKPIEAKYKISDMKSPEKLLMSGLGGLTSIGGLSGINAQAESRMQMINKLNSIDAKLGSVLKVDMLDKNN